MNFKRGLFRAWIVLSLLWFCFAAVMFFSDTKADMRRCADQDTFDLAYRKAVLTKKLKEAGRRIRTAHPAVKEDLRPKMIFEEAMDSKGLKTSFEDLPIAVHYRGEERHFSLDTTAKDIREEFLFVVNKARYKAFGKYLGILFLPSAALFILGSLLLWVVEGFRTSGAGGKQ